MMHAISSQARNTIALFLKIESINVLKNQGINLLNCMQMKLGNGDKTALWEDIWIGHIVLKDLYPRIYALETCKFVKVGTKLTQSSLDFSFRRKPRGGIEQEQYEALLVQVQDVNLVPVSDRWKWSLENSGDFSVASVRKMLDDKMLPDVTTKTRWIKLVPIKVNVHAWKVKIDSLPTRFNISRRGMDIESITCSICDNEVESSSHLFFKCNMVRDIIRKITRWWDITYIEADSYEDWLNWLVNLRLSSNYKQALEGVFYVMWWHVWQYRNKYIFEAVSSPKAMIFEDIVPDRLIDQRLNNMVKKEKKEDIVKKMGQTMGYKMEGCMKDIEEIETKMELVDLFSIRACWGNLTFDYVFSPSVGNSGGILCVWDSNMFHKENSSVSDYFVAIMGKWRPNNKNLLIISVYAPQDLAEKKMLWQYLNILIDRWNGDVIVMGDFNEVRHKDERYGSIFNARGADAFNSFISAGGLVEVPSGGYSFTWSHNSASKMSKLDRFLVSDNLQRTCPNLSSLTLDRFLSDHRPILLRELNIDYGPTPFHF
ncbi:RNA-directed DNA polymerase, eukaryota [Tanacetum coccineum]